ncbi:MULTISPECIES: NADPH-dependent FMN reductase [Amycolatopsis]|uniref:NAD(P)H-dependent oxidoreductase n=1 Tax=Amycolatopsis thermalba TaxID=944492 RepID=A0ABY4P3G6_9PSEU|nr:MULTISPECIES: NAD(P)H-dependent oxidoreductase [Amycolatopsis]OXM71110.1 NADPH-dependent FMN reductase [Amycolatopsis sp. KNN50.9b]UQS26811.1 NAD(P)H-dependent oxidoreductase [Amycolatopsis thermalba]
MEPLDVAVIIGSTRDGRFGPVVAKWFAEQAAAHGEFRVDVIDLADANLPAALSGRPTPEVAAVSERLEKADAFVVVTPEYNHSYPASLKTMLDWHGTQWQAKPVAFVSYGGLSGGLRAVEHLRPVFAELHAVTIRETVSFHGAWSQFDDRGELVNPEGPTAAAKALLDQLAWWSHTLRDARRTRPYAS